MNVQGDFTLSGGDRWVHNSSGLRVDYGSTDAALLPIPDPKDPFGTRVFCDPLTANDCVMRDQPYVSLLRFHKDSLDFAIRGSYSFSAEVWVMFKPAGGELVPESKAAWSWSGTVEYDRNLPNRYKLANPTTSGITTFAETDSWPIWVYDSGDKDGWWTKNP